MRKGYGKAMRGKAGPLLKSDYMRRGHMLSLTMLICVVLQAREPEHTRHAMVVSGDPFATDVGVRVLQNGGNAVDAAVAVGFALAVTYPYAGNLGGGGFMLIR